MPDDGSAGKMSQLDPVQIAALDFARGKPGVGWFIDRGLGKSLTALTEFHWYGQRGDVDRMIAVCPGTFREGWLDEIEKHNFNFDVHIFEAARKREASAFVSRPHNRLPVFIVNYESFRMPNILKALCIWASRGQTYLAIDESIQIKGHKSKQTKAAHRLVLACRYVRLLTGKPQTQGPQDLWAQLRAIGLFKDRNFYAFRNTYCIMGGWQDKEVKAVKNAPELAAIMAPWIFVAKKKDWAPNLPRKDYTILDYEMSGEQLAQYRQMETQFLLEIERGKIVTVDVAIAKYAKLAQIMTGFIYDAGHVAHELVMLDKNPRLQLLLETLRDESGKTCVVYKHQAIFDILMRELVEWRPAWIKGEMKQGEVTEQKARFNSDPDCRAILLQCDAAKYSHTLLGGPRPEDLCRTMMFFENTYNADTRDQIEDRIHRRGQTGERVLYIDFSGSPLDRRIVKALQRKQSLYEAVFSHLKVAEPA